MLTTQQHKYEYFKYDIHFLEGWQSAAATLGARGAARLSQQIVALTIKPEGILCRKVQECLDFMVANQFVPIHSECFSYDRLMSREMWRYQWNIATPDRLEVADRINNLADALQIFFLDTTTPLRIPASSRLVPLKGLGTPSERDAVRLRSMLGSPNRLLVVVHSPDEPIDNIRELAIIFGRERLENLYQHLKVGIDGNSSDPQERITKDIEYLYGRHETQSLIVQDAVTATLELIRRTETSETGEARLAAARAREAILAAQSGEEFLSWRSWSADLTACGIPLSWEPLVAATHLIRHDIPGAKCLVGRSGRQKWAAGEGHMIESAAYPAVS